MPGRWKTSHTPYFVDVLEAASDPRTRQITCVTASQLGKTASIMSLIGHRFGDGPRVPTLFVLPTQAMAGSMSAERVARLLRDSPSLDEIHAKGKSNSKFEKWIGGVPLRFGWSGSASTLAAFACGLVLIDELDRMGRDVDGEGDPVTLAKARTKNYPNPLVVTTSSPTIEDASPIQSLFDQGSREMYEWPCPHCGDFHRPMSKYLKWPDGAAPELAELDYTYCCPHCGAVIDESDRLSMIHAGRFLPYKRNADGDYEPSGEGISDYRHRSFWISGFLSPWTPFATMARELCEGYRTREPETIQAKLNTYCGEVWRTRGDAPDWQEVGTHCASYERGTKPDGVQVVTVGVDVQHDRLYYVVRGWGADNGPMESWLLDWGELLGRTDMDDVYTALTAILRRHEFGVRRCFVDSGYKPQSDYFKRPDHQIYTYCRRLAPVTFPAKGYDGRNKPVEPNRIDVSMGGQTIKNGVTLYRVDVSHFKQWLYSRVRPAGEGSVDLWHIPRELDEDYARQVVAEELITKASGHMIWRCPPSRANHYLDCEVLATAAAYSLNAYTLNPRKPQTPAAAASAARQSRPAYGSRFARSGL